MIGLAPILLWGLAGQGPPSNYPQAADLSIRGFAQEVLFGYGMQRTPRFDDYTKGSYHLSPAGLAAALPKEAALYKLDLRALVVVGPSGPLWSYDVVAFVQEQDCVRVNWLVVPHARITVKKSACVPSSVTTKVLESTRSLVKMVVGDKTPDDSCLLVAEYGEAKSTRAMPSGCYAEKLPAEFDAFDAVLNDLYKRLELTYSGYGPDNER